MKKSIKLIVLLFAIAFATNTFASELGIKMSNLNFATSKANSKSKKESSGGIEKGDIQLDVSFNVGSHGPIYVSRGYGYGSGSGYGYGYGFRPGFTLNIDGAVHKYASVGGYIGFDASINGRYYSRYNRNMGLGFGARGVFHIYQLIADKTSSKPDPGKLDFYAAFHIGGIMYISTNGEFVNDGYKRVYGGLSAGASVGVRYYFNSKIGIIGQVGWGEMSFMKVGLAVKL